MLSMSVRSLIATAWLGGGVWGAPRRRCRDIFETFESAVPNWDVGDTVRLAGNRPFRVTATIPVEKMSEFVDEPLYGVLEVEPLFASGRSRRGHRRLRLRFGRRRGGLPLRDRRKW